MALEGSLRDFGLADILQLIYFQKKTGILSLEGQNDRVSLMFSEGNVVSAESRRRIEDNRIGKILLKKGLIKDDDLRTSLEEQKTTGVRLGDIFLKQGLVRKEDIEETLVSQMKETVVQLFSWKEGTYQFQTGMVSPNREMPVTLDTQHLLMDGLRIIDEWSLVEGKVTLDTVFRKTGLTEPVMSGAEESILKFVDGESEVSIIIELGGVDNFEATKVLASLMERGIIEPVTTSPATVTQTALPAEAERASTAAIYPVLFLVALMVLLAVAGLQETWSGRGPAMFLGGDSLKRVKTVRDVDGLRFMAEAYKYRNGSYPGRLEQIGDARDAWGRPYSYRVESDTLIILSAGPDGEVGTEDDIY
jgi:hypothetical protein